MFASVAAPSWVAQATETFLPLGLESDAEIVTWRWPLLPSLDFVLLIEIFGGSSLSRMLTAHFVFAGTVAFVAPVTLKKKFSLSSSIASSSTGAEMSVKTLLSVPFGITIERPTWAV